MPKIPKKTIYPKGIVREYAPRHVYSDGQGGIWDHDGWARDCPDPRCGAAVTETWEAAAMGSRPGSYSDEFVESWTVPQATDPCPKYRNGEHRWTWADDGNGHSGDVCACGAVEI